MLDKVTILSDSAELKTARLDGFISQRPNRKWFNLFKVPMLPYSFCTSDSTKRWNRFMRRVGEAPVIEDSLQTLKCQRNICSAVQNLGYMDASVDIERHFHKRKVDVTYHINPRTRYKVDMLERDVRDAGLDSLFRAEEEASLLSNGMYFDMNVLDAERSRMSTVALNNGYYRFNREFIRYEADTTIDKNVAWLRQIVEPYRTVSVASAPHQQFRFGKVVFDQSGSNSLLRHGVLHRVNHIREGELYNEHQVQQTYSSLGALDAVMGSSIHFTQDEEDSTKINALVNITANKPNSINAELEGTNTAGDLGAAVAVSYKNRNLFHGSEVLGLKVRGAFEAITGLDGYDDQNYLEFSSELSLKFPDFLFPFLSEEIRRSSRATSEVSLMYDSQNRPEFHRRVVTGAWRYRWTSKNSRIHNRIDLLNLNYVFMPWISSTFKQDYLDDPTSRNAILRYNYENLFIMSLGYVFNYSSLGNSMTSSYGKNAYSLRLAVESSGNLLEGISSMTRASKNDVGNYEVFGIAFAQYAKLDFDFAKSFRIDDANSLAIHFGLGVAYPYGNTAILPYEKRYFSGGANSVRGWSVRELGPGRFRGTDGRIDFINQTGDMKLDMNVEYRTHLFWKIDGAAFIDAGNIWTLRSYEDQPGGQFGFDTFWREIAVSYGIGFRLNFNYFIIRLDGGMKAINPAFTDNKGHYPLIHPNMKRDFTFHFAVGLPF